MRVLARARLLNLGLLLLALLSVAGVFWTSRLQTSGERQVRQRHVLSVFRQDEVQKVEIRQGPRRTVLVRRAPKPSALAFSRDPSAADGAEAADRDPSNADPGDAEWSLAEPFETDADSAPVDKLLGSLQYATWEREIEGTPATPVELDAASDMPLSEHELRLVSGSLSYALRLGRDAVSPPGARYVEVQAGSAPARVFVIKKRLVDELFVDGDTFRGRQIVPYRKSSVDRMVLSSAAGVRRLKRAGTNFVFDEMEDGQRVERHSLDRIFLALSRAVAEPFVDVEVAKAALSTDASIRVALVPVQGDKPEASLEFGGSCPNAPDKTLALRHLPEPLAGCVDRSVLYALREPASVLIDSGLFSFDADEVDSIQIVEGEAVLDFARSGDGFVLRQPRSSELDTEAAEDRLSLILGMRGDLLTGRAKPSAGAEYSAATVTLESSARSGEERVKEAVRVSAPLADGSRRVLREVDAAVLVISQESALGLHADATLLKDHQVFDYAIKEVRKIDMVSGSVKQTVERSPEGALSLIAPKGYEVDGGLASELFDQLRTLRALRWVSDRASTGFGLAKPRAQVKLVVEVEGREVERTLSIGQSAPGGFYASVDRDPGVFVAPRGIERVLGTWLLDRAVFRADRDSIVELSLSAEGLGSVLLRRVAGQLTLQKGSSDFDTARIDELLLAIESLRPEAAVHLGPALPGEGLRRPILVGVVRCQAPANVGTPPIRFSIGSRDSLRDASIYYARHGSVNATYALPRAQVQRLLDLF